MLLEQLTLHNLGVYRGRQTVDLSPRSPDKPVILFGGLNGGGKTTLLDALQLALYGNRARCSNRNGSSYEDFIRRSVNRTVPPSEGAGVELKFTVQSGGEPVTYDVLRTWQLTDKSMREELTVLINGTVDPLLTESWSEHIEELLPLEISQLFFFDGEKIEALANVQRSGELIRSAVYSLLGLDLVERLKTDLSVLTRKKRTALHNPETQQEIEKLRAELENAETRKGELVQERAGVQNRADRTRTKLEDVERAYRLEGGERYESQLDLERDRASIEHQINSEEEQLRGLAAAETPLLLVQDLLTELSVGAQSELDAHRATVLVEALAERDSRLLEEVSTLVNAAQLERIESLLADDRASREPKASDQRYLGLSSESLLAVGDLRHNRLPLLSERLATLRSELQGLRRSLIEIERQIASIPSTESLATIIEQRELLGQQLATEESELLVLSELVERSERDVEVAEARLVRVIEKQIDSDFETEAHSRTILHAERAQLTLTGFRDSLIDRHRASIETAVSKAFTRLLRKEGLVERVQLDPEDLSLLLVDSTGRTIDPDRLSAGERQLLAVAMLWGLAEVSGRDIPTVVDTPLGRLDSIHREYLVNRYFPRASHQILLLSTDEEIDRALYSALEPSISRTYLLNFDDETQSTAISEMYFFDKEVVHAG